MAADKPPTDQSFVVSNATKVASENAEPSLDNITEADTIAIGVSIWRNFQTNYYLRANAGSLVVQEDGDDIDEEFYWEGELLAGIEWDTAENGHLLAELGYGYMERLPKDEWRSVVRLGFVYDLDAVNAYGAFNLSVEMNGLEHDDQEEAQVRIGYQTDPAILFKKLAGLFIKEKKDDKKK